MASPIDNFEVRAYRIPTDAPESDGTLQWDATTIVVVQITVGGHIGTGYTYGPRAVGTLIQDKLGDTLTEHDPMAIPACWDAMWRALRNAGQPGIGAMAVAAVDGALHDLKARRLGIALADLFGRVREGVDIYGSGGFTSYDTSRLAEQLSGWAELGIKRVKMKVGRDPAADPARVETARRAIGDDTALMVDANGAYTRKQALAMSHQFAERFGVDWHEEPRPSADLDGLGLLRDHGPAGMDIAAGEYGDKLEYFQHMLDAQAVDCLQADASRCGGYTGFLKVAALCEARLMPLSAHCYPQLHAHVCCATPALRHIEYFHDHVRIMKMLFEGVLQPRDGRLVPEADRPGTGLTLKDKDAERYRI